MPFTDTMAYRSYVFVFGLNAPADLRLRTGSRVLTTPLSSYVVTTRRVYSGSTGKCHWSSEKKTPILLKETYLLFHELNMAVNPFPLPHQ